MSHDQKPGKLRVVGQASPGRRRTDVVVASAAALPTTIDAPAADRAAKKPVLLLSLLFVAGCALGGAALPLLGLV